MPIRKVRHIGGKHRNMIGFFPSIKQKRMIEFESSIERDLIFLLDYEEDVQAYEEQPLTIKYEKDGPRSYTPDFRVVRRRGTEIIECKRFDQIDRDENQIKFEVGRRWCAERGYTFRIVTERDLRSNFRLDNVKLLTRFALHSVLPDLKARIFSELLRNQTLALGTLAQTVYPADTASVVRAVCHLAFHHAVAVALDNAQLSVDSLIQLPRPVD